MLFHINKRDPDWLPLEGLKLSVSLLGYNTSSGNHTVTLTTLQSTVSDLSYIFHTFIKQQVNHNFFINKIWFLTWCSSNSNPISSQTVSISDSDMREYLWCGKGRLRILSLSLRYCTAMMLFVGNSFRGFTLACWSTTLSLLTIPGKCVILITLNTPWSHFTPKSHHHTVSPQLGCYHTKGL